MEPKAELPVRTFEEMLLTEEEREKKREEDERDKALAAYYRSVFDDPEAFLEIRENTDDDILETDV